MASEATKKDETTAAAPPAAAAEEERYLEEPEVVTGDWKLPQVQNLEVQEVHTGEEGEEVFWKHRAKLYRWAKDTSEWKERGLGDAKLLKHKSTGKIRFLLRQEKTFKVVANHYVVDDGKCCNLKPNVSSEKIWVWSVVDSAEEEPRLEQFGLKFGDVEVAKEFKAKFEDAAKLNGPLFGATAGSEKKPEEKTETAKEETKTETKSDAKKDE